MRRLDVRTPILSAETRGPGKNYALGDHDVAHCFELAASRLLERDELGTVGDRPAISY